jgi:hypothetical protein
MFCFKQVLFKYMFALQLSNFLFDVRIFVYAVHLTRIYNLNLGCLHPVACMRSGQSSY